MPRGHARRPAGGCGGGGILRRAALPYAFHRRVWPGAGGPCGAFRFLHLRTPAHQQTLHPPPQDRGSYPPGGGGAGVARPGHRRGRSPLGPLGRLGGLTSGSPLCAPIQSHGTGTHQGCPGRGGTGHQRPAHRGARAAHGPVRRQWRGQVHAAGHDGPLYRGGCGRGGPDWRAGQGSQGLHREHPGGGGTASCRRGGRPGRFPSAPAAPWRGLCHGHRRVFP